jgi:zinc transporter ZupT
VGVTLLLQESLSVRASRTAATQGVAQHRVARSVLAALSLGAFLAITASTSMSPGTLSIISALTAGASVYVSASMLIPESHQTHSQAPTLSMTVASSIIIYGLVQLT